MNTLPAALVKDRVQEVERTDRGSGIVVGKFPAGDIAQTWLDEHSR